jgi:polyisoprenoid-binding protein YceI
VFNSKHGLTDLSAIIKVSSIKTGMESRDAHILKEDFFDERNYKTISFKSIKIERIKDSYFQAQANLTIKDITKKISIPISINTINDEVRITSEFEINRLDYGVGGRSLVLGKTVKINVRHSYIK